VLSRPPQRRLRAIARLCPLASSHSLELEPGEQVGDAALASGAGLEPVDQVDGGVEAPARAAADAVPGDRHSEMALARAGAADQNPVALGAKRVKTKS
jgi:hypothetical protein